MKENVPIMLELKRLHHDIGRYMESLWEGPPAEEMTGLNGWIIGYIANQSGPVYQKDLERHFGMARSTVSRIVNLMVKKGMLHREPVEADARLKKLVITKKAQTFSALKKEDLQKAEQQLTRGFTAQEKKQMRSYLSRFQENIRREL